MISEDGENHNGPFDGVWFQEAGREFELLRQHKLAKVPAAISKCAAYYEWAVQNQFFSCDARGAHDWTILVRAMRLLYGPVGVEGSDENRLSAIFSSFKEPKTRQPCEHYVLARLCNAICDLAAQMRGTEESTQAAD